jgi:transposase
VIEMGARSWLVAGLVPGVERQPLKKLEPDAHSPRQLLERWQSEAIRSGHAITRIAVAYEAGRDGFWLARWLQEHGIEAHVIHVASVAVSREHRRAKTDRLDTEMLKRAFLGWLRGERDHCKHPALRAYREATNTVLKSAKLLGLTPVSRGKVCIPSKPPIKSKFCGFRSR